MSRNIEFNITNLDAINIELNNFENVNDLFLNNILNNATVSQSEPLKLKDFYEENGQTYQNFTLENYSNFKQKLSSAIDNIKFDMNLIRESDSICGT